MNIALSKLLTVAKIKRGVVFFILVIMLAGCIESTFYKTDFGDKNEQLRIKALSSKLYDYGIDIVNDGKHISFVLPGKSLFNVDSANFNSNAYRIMDLISNLSRYYNNSEVSIIGFFVNNSIVRVDKYLAIERAKCIMQYLWSAGIAATFLYADTISAALMSNNKLSSGDFIIINFNRL